MNLRHIIIVFKKEVIDLLRDRKTVFATLFIPMLLIPLLNLLLSSGVKELFNEINENVPVALAQDSNTPEIIALVKEEIISKNNHIQLLNAQNPYQALHLDKIRAILSFEKNYQTKLQAKEPFRIQIIYDKSQNKSAGSIEIIAQAITEFNQAVVAERIVSLGGKAEMAEAAQAELVNIADARQVNNSFLMLILPLMIGILMAVGGIPAATDLVAGEKERGSLEPLLATKPNRQSILFGKYLAIALFSFISVLASIAGLIFSYFINPQSSSLLGEVSTSGMNIPPLAILFVLAIAFTLGLTFAGIQVALSTFARSFKEAQTYLSYLIFAVMIPGYATLFTQPSDIPIYMFFLPILNTLSAIKIVLGGYIIYRYLAMALLSSFLYVFAALLFATILFNKEKVLFRS